MKTRIAMGVFAIMFATLALLAWRSAGTTPSIWKGCPNITYRAQHPLPTPPEAFFAEFQPMSVDGKPVQTALILKPVSNMNQLMLAAQRKERPCWPNCVDDKTVATLDQKWIHARVMGHRE